MANRFWVGGTGTWNTTSTTNWSTASGGASGASVPTAADSVFFDQAGTYTVTMTGALNCLDITVSAGTVTFATGTTPTLSIAGSMSLLAGTVWSANGAITFTATTTGKTVTTSGVTIAGSMAFNGAGGGWTLGSALTCNSAIGLTTGTFDTSSSGNYAVTATNFSAAGSATRTINFNASTITLTGTNGFNGGLATGITFNAGTSQINLSNVTTTLSTPGLTFYNVAFTSTTTAGTRVVTGANTYNNFAVTAPSTAGVATVTFDSKQIINGTLSTTGTAGNQRVFFASATYGIAQDLAVNVTPSLTDADFRGIYVTGTAAPISGTRIGNRGECRNITFSTPKTVYLNAATDLGWSGNAWASSSGGAVNTNNFPLPQDTAVINNTSTTTGLTFSSSITYLPTVDCSTRTNALSFTVNANTVYGSWTNGSGISFNGVNTLTFQGGGTQTITSAGKTFSGPITIDTYGGTVQLADALNIGANTLTVTNGTFTTAGYAVTAGGMSSNNSNVRTINLGASTVTVNSSSAFTFTNTTNLTFNAGTSTINAGPEAANNQVTVDAGPGLSFYNMRVEGSSLVASSILGANTFNNLTIVCRSFIDTPMAYTFNANQTVNGTLTVSGVSATKRVFIRSNTLGTQRTITAASIAATDCDFRDIAIAGAASGASPTRAGDCGGNSGITFPAPKTVYWNLAGAYNYWSFTGWATSSGGAPAVNNFPLAQDTAVFDNAGAAVTVDIQTTWNIGTVDASNRTSAMSLQATSSNFGGAVVYGDWKFGAGITFNSGTIPLNFAKNGTQTITSNGVQFGCQVNISHPSGTVQLADALSLISARGLALGAGTFDAVTYNVTAGAFSSAVGSTTRMGTGAWTMSGTGTVWTGAGTNIASTSTIVLSDTSTTARTFTGGGLYYNKLTIGGATGISTLTITGNNTFGELASTKTVAHTIALGTTVQTFGKWSVTGTVGNVVTVTGTSTTNVIAGPRVSGVDYLAMGTIGFSTTSPGEFYAGANSTGTGAGVILTAAPATRNLFWVGGTGNWSSTTKWSTSSGGASGAAIPTSADTVTFDSASNATAYTATIDAGVTIARCASFTMAGPASGNVTLAGSVNIAYHGNISFAAAGVASTYSGTYLLCGNSSYTITANGVFASNINVFGIGSTWTLGSAVSVVAFTMTYGGLNTSASNYALSYSNLASNNSNVRSLTLNGSTVTQASNSLSITTTNLTLSAGTSQWTFTTNIGISLLISGSLAFYNASFTNVASSSAFIQGTNTFNNLTFVGRTTVGITQVTFVANQTINGTLTVNAGTASAYRNFLASDTIGTTRTLTCAAVSLTDVDFRDITIAGAAAPASGTRLGDAKGNSGITFPAAKTVYWAVNSANWGATGAGSWSATSGGAAANDQFPLPQDTAYIPFATPTSGSTITINANYNIGTLDMSNRNGSALVTLATGTTTPTIYGNWINGTGTTLSGTGAMTFAGRGSQTITSAGRSFSQNLQFNTPGGSITLQDAFTTTNNTTNANTLTAGTFDANGYNVTTAATINGNCGFGTSGSLSKVIAIGVGTWTIGCGGSAWNNAGTNVTVTGTGTISLTGTTTKSFVGGGISYSGITLNNGGALTLTISGNNTFKTITNTYSATGATSIALANTTQTLTNPWTATGAAGNILTVSGTSAAAPATLIFSGSGTAANVDYLSISNVRAYDLLNEWYAGTNSTNGGSLGWYFVAAGGSVYSATITETGTGSDSILARAIFKGTISETGTGTDSISAALGGITYLGTISELATGSDAVLARAIFRASLAESGLGTDTISARSAFGSRIIESATIADTNLARLIARATLSETATGSDTESAKLSARSTLSETATGTETVTPRYVARPTISEAATGTETVSPRYTARPSIAETATGTDTEAAKLTAKSSIAESATGTDTDSATRTTRPSISETATVTDTDSAKMSARSTVSELATISDLASARARLLAAVTESATATDLISSIKGLFAYIVESASITDSVNAPGSIYRPNVSESATAADTVAALSRFASRVSESATITDAVTAFKRYLAAVLETALGLDSVTAKFIARSVVSELATGTDLNVVRFIAKASISEAATGTDTEAARYIANPSVAESTTITDTDAARITARSSIVESAAGSDTDAAKLTVNPAISETATGSDSISAFARFRAAVSEAATITDLIYSIKGYFVFILESATGSDTFSAKYTVNPSVVESASITDAVAARYIALPSIFESASGSDIIVGGLRFIGVVAETATGTETVATQYIARPTIAETATGSDTDAAKLSAAARIAETAAGTEAINARATFNSDIAERSSVIEIVRAYFVAAARVSELATGTDQISALRALAARVAETATITDSVSAKARFIGLLQEAATAQDAVNAPGSVYNVLMQELAQTQDSFTAKARFRSSITETATGTETNRAAFTPRARITESATITDAASALPRYAARVLETSAASDSVLVAPSIFNAIAVASATALDNLNAPGSIYNVTIPESATLSDSVLGAYLWNLIDDSQPESWQNVLDAQSVTWSAINASQTAGWGEVDSAQATSWGNADSAQAPGWQDAQTSQTGTWNSVDDSQNVNWQNVVDEQSGSWNAVNNGQTAGWGNTQNAQSGTWNKIQDDQDPDWKDIPTL